MHLKQCEEKTHCTYNMRAIEKVAAKPMDDGLYVAAVRKIINPYIWVHWMRWFGGLKYEIPFLLLMVIVWVKCGFSLALLIVFFLFSSNLKTNLCWFFHPCIRFRTCLKMADSSSATMVGKLFFNIVQSKCFVLKPEKTCTKRSWWGKCEKMVKRKRAHLRDNRKFWGPTKRRRCQ